jgi:hypothetical protein
MRRAFHIALAAAACVAAPRARAQFRSTPMILYAPDHGADVLPFGFDATPPESDLLALYPAQTALPYWRHHGLLARLASPVVQPSPYDCVAAGRLAQNASDGLTDVAYCVVGTGSPLRIAFGNARGVLQSYTVQLNTRGAPKITFAHLLPRDADVIVVPRETGGGFEGLLDVLDFDSAAVPSTATTIAQKITASQQGRSTPQPEEVWTMRIGAAARALGIDDLYIPGSASLQLFENLTGASGAISLGDGILMEPQAGIALADCQGAAPLDVDFDGVLDLVVSLSLPVPTYAPGGGRLYWIRGTGTLADFASALWTELGSDPALDLVDPFVVRPLQLGGEPAVAVWDRGLDEVLVIRAIGGSLVVWRGVTAGRHVRDIRLADVVGSTAPDLVVDGTGVYEEGLALDPAILVYPDAGDASPVLAWAPGSPGAPERGEDHPMGVAASDADAGAGFPRVDWIVGDPWFDPVAGSGSIYVHSGADLCGAPPQTLPVTVRAVDEYGVYAELGATLDVSEAPPRIEIVGAVPPGRLVLPPGGTGLVVEGSAWSRCAVSFAWGISPWPTEWGTSPWPPEASVTIDGGPGWTSQSVDLLEAAYPELLDLLAGTPAVVLTATDSTDPGNPREVVATLPLDIDASALVELGHESDLAVIKEGEVAMLETRITSRLGVTALPFVHVVHALAGLASAGEPEAEGATVVETRAGGTEVVLDALPPAGAEVVVHLPVRWAGGRAASAVEVRSSGGHLLTPAASAPVEAAPMPGCGCRSSPAGGALALAALLALRRRSRLT